VEDWGGGGGLILSMRMGFKDSFTDEVIFG